MSSVTAIQPQQSQSIAAAPFFSPEQEQMILRNFLGGASKDEAHVLLEIVKRRRLDPFSRQVYFVKRWDSAKREEVWAIQISIDGLRALAERTGRYDGQDEPEYGKDEAGEFAKVRVYRKDWSPNRAAVGIAYLSEFIQKKKDGTTTAFWARMPRLMLAKCAEALAIRKAFPEDASGLYIPEEMPETAAQEAREVKQVQPEPSPSPEQTKALPANDNSARVASIWARLVAEMGETKTKEKTKSRAALEAAGKSVFGDTPKPSNEWTSEDCAAIEKRLFDVPF